MPRFLVPFPWLVLSGLLVLQSSNAGDSSLQQLQLRHGGRFPHLKPGRNDDTIEPAQPIGALADNDGMASSCKSGSRPIREVDRFSKQPPGRARFAAYIPPCPIHAPTSPVSCTCNLRSDTQTPSTIFTSSTKTCLGADFRHHPNEIQAFPLRPSEMNHVVATCEMSDKTQDPRPQNKLAHLMAVKQRQK